MRAHALLAVVALFGCGDKKPKDRETVAKEYREVLTPKLEAIVYAGAVAYLNKDDAGSAAPPAGLDFTDEKTSNAIAVQFDDVKELAKKTEEPGAYFGTPLVRFTNELGDPYRIARQILGIVDEGFSLAPDVGYYAPQLDRLVRARYVLVVIQGNATLPALPLSGDGFTPGEVEGKAVLVELEGAKPLGGFSVSASNSDEVFVQKYKPGADHSVESEMSLDKENERKLKRNLEAEFSHAIAKGIETRFPGAKTPYSFTDLY